MGEIYFVRHAESDTNVHDDFSRPLTLKGKMDRSLVTNYLKNKDIHYVFSSPYVRAIETVRHLAEELDVTIESINDFKERYITNNWIDNFESFSNKQWSDFNYKFSDGESLNEVQIRNIEALKSLLEKYRDENMVVGSHGTAICTILNYFYPSFGFDDFNKMKKIMPWIVRLSFDGKNLIEAESINVLENNEVAILGELRR